MENNNNFWTSSYNLLLKTGICNDFFLSQTILLSHYIILP